MKQKSKNIRKTQKLRNPRKTRKPRKQYKTSKRYKNYRGGMDEPLPPPTKLIRVEDIDYSFNIVIKNSEGVETNVRIDGKYSGPWKYDKPYQKGTLVVFNSNNEYKSKYEGNWIDGVPNGNGVTIFATGNRYEGEYKDGIENGKGIKTYANGNHYEGDFKNGTLNGNGILNLNGGDTYTGQFRDGIISGNGVLQTIDGNKYEGGFRNNQKYGYGVLTYANGDVYQGEWRDNLRYGIGTLTTETRQYTGVWQNGKPSGDGQMKFFKTGVIINGVFTYINSRDSDELLKIKGTALYPDGSTYTGTFIDYEKSDDYGRANPPENSLASNDSYHVRFGFEDSKPDSITSTPFL